MTTDRIRYHLRNPYGADHRGWDFPSPYIIDSMKRMEYDKKFGNIALYLYQVRNNVNSLITWHSKYGPYALMEQADYKGYATGQMMKFLLKRFAKPHEIPLLDESQLSTALFRRDIPFTSSSLWHIHNNETSSSVCFGDFRILFRDPQWNKHPIEISIPTLGTPLFIYRELCHVSADDMIDVLMVLDSLRVRLAAIAHEEYSARISRTKSNRIRRIAAKYRRECKE